MSAVWLKLTTLLCVSCTALSHPAESNGVVWRSPGQYVTIQCRSTQPGVEYLTLYKGLSKEVQVIQGSQSDTVIPPTFTSRLQVNEEFPNMDILINNLTCDDTGPYWCVYKTYNIKSGKVEQSAGNGSALLVVTEEVAASGDQMCDTNHHKLVLVSVVISAIVLLTFIVGALIWIFKTKTLRRTKKPRLVASSDVYEDMRGTLRH